MANRNSKTKNNAPGKYYVDTECIACDACVLAAEGHFKVDASAEPAFAYIFKQPKTEEEHTACEEAMESCPVEAIGDDGV